MIPSSDPETTWSKSRETASAVTETRYSPTNSRLFLKFHFCAGGEEVEVDKECEEKKGD